MLTEITVSDPMYVYFELNERDLLTVIELYRQRIKEKGLDPSNEEDQKAEIVLELLPRRGETEEFHPELPGEGEGARPQLDELDQELDRILSK